MSGLSISEETNPTLCIQYGFEGTHPWKLKSQHFNSTVIVSSPIHCAGVQSQHNTERTSLPSSPASLTSSLPCFCLSFLFHYAFRQLSSPSTSSPPPLLSYPSLSLSSCRGAVTCLRKPNRTLRSYLTASCYACVCVCECLCVWERWFYYSYMSIQKRNHPQEFLTQTRMINHSDVMMDLVNLTCQMKGVTVRGWSLLLLSHFI